jgi:hypothetical protein
MRRSAVSCAQLQRDGPGLTRSRVVLLCLFVGLLCIVFVALFCLFRVVLLCLFALLTVCVVALSLCVGSHGHLLSQRHIFYLVRHQLYPSRQFSPNKCVCTCVQYSTRNCTALRARVHAQNTAAGRLNHSSPPDPSRGRAGCCQGSAGRIG